MAWEGKPSSAAPEETAQEGVYLLIITSFCVSPFGLKLLDVGENELPVITPASSSVRNKDTGQQVGSGGKMTTQPPPPTSFLG